MSCVFFSKNNNSSNSIVFSPPNPPNYSIENKNNKNNSKNKNNKNNSNNYGSLITELNFNHPIFKNINYPNIAISCYSIKKILNSKNNIIILHIKNNTPEKKRRKQKITISESSESLNSNNSSSNSTEKNKNKITLLFSQGTKTDLGKIYPRLIDMSNILNCNIISYDYSGFGFSSGYFSLETINEDLEEVLNFILNHLEIKLENIILYGKTIGSSPSIFISSKDKYCSIKGLILQSPYYFYNYNGKDKDKIFINNNMALIKNVDCPVLLIHGKLDDIIPYEHIDFFSKNINEYVKWFPEKGNHNNIICDLRSKYYKIVKNFIERIVDSRLKISNNDILFNEENCLEETIIKFSYNKNGISNSQFNSWSKESFEN